MLTDICNAYKYMQCLQIYAMLIQKSLAVNERTNFRDISMSSLIWTYPKYKSCYAMFL